MTAAGRSVNGALALAGVLLCVPGFGALAAQRLAPDLEAMSFAPRRYVSYRVASRINIDGKLDEPAWSAAGWTGAFIDIEGGTRPHPRKDVVDVTK